MMKYILAAFVAACTLVACNSGGGSYSAGEFTSQQDSIAYALGYTLAGNTLKDGVELNSAMMVKGYNETEAGGSYMDDDGFRSLMVGLQTELQARQGQPFGEGEEPAVTIDSLSYAMGYNLAKNMMDFEIDMNPDFVGAGNADHVSGKELRISEETINNLMVAFEQQQRAAYETAQAKKAAPNIAEGEAFLAENKEKPGVVELPSGLQYKIIRKGSGTSPTADKLVSVHYEGRLLDGKVFDSSYERGSPAEFPVTGVIKGWTEALQLMKPGAKWELFIPSELAYGNMGQSDIPPGATLNFDVELLEVKDKPAAPQMPQMPNQ